MCHPAPVNYPRRSTLGDKVVFWIMGGFMVAVLVAWCLLLGQGAVWLAGLAGGGVNQVVAWLQ